MLGLLTFSYGAGFSKGGLISHSGVLIFNQDFIRPSLTGRIMV